MYEAYRFGRAELRPGARQLLIDGVEASLGNRAFDLLTVLLERRGRLVTKSELLDLVWPGLIVEENNLQVQMSQLRRLLGPQTITTVPGRGYRFDALVQASDAPASTLMPSAAGVAPQAPTTSLFGRERDIDTLVEWCAAPGLVTIVGAGGIGKTRLALALAARCDKSIFNGVAWVDLSVVSDSALVVSALANALGLTLVPGVDPFETLCSALGRRTMLILIDNAEHLADAVARAVSRLTSAVPSLRVIVTSQQALKIPGERLYRLAPLVVPQVRCTVEEAAASSAVALFVDRATAQDRRLQLTPQNVDDVVRICRRLDGIPLAIELATARLPLLGVNGLLQHLDDRFAVLTAGNRGAPTKQQTLRAALDWSYELLDDDARTTLRRIAVFVGGFGLDAARSLASDERRNGWVVLDSLATLVDRSFVNVDDHPKPRYSLAETTRTYALERLREAGELEALRRRHAALMCHVMDSAFADFWSIGDDDYVARYAPELDNFRAAMGWAREGDPTGYVSMAAASTPLLRHLSLIREGIEYLTTASLMVAPQMPIALRARLALSSAMLGGSSQAAEQSMALHRQAGDERGLYISLYWQATRNDTSTTTLQALVSEKRRLEHAYWPEKVLSLGRGVEEELLYREKRYAEALSSLARRIDAYEAVGATDGVTSALMYRVLALFGAGDLTGALEQALRVVDRCRRLGNHYRLACIEASAFTAMLLVDEQRLAVAYDHAQAFATLDQTLGWPHIGDAADGFALLALEQGRIDAAAVLSGFADRLFGADGQARDPISAAARERAESRLRTALPPERRALLAAEGHAIGPEQAARLGLSASA